jgi:hypothetical protein
MRGRLHRFDQHLSSDAALEATEIFGSDDDDLVSSMDSDMLWSLAADLTNQLTEASFGVL